MLKYAMIVWIISNTYPILLDILSFYRKSSEQKQIENERKEMNIKMIEILDIINREVIINKKVEIENGIKFEYIGGGILTFDDELTT